MPLCHHSLKKLILIPILNSALLEARSELGPTHSPMLADIPLGFISSPRQMPKLFFISLQICLLKSHSGSICAMEQWDRSRMSLPLLPPRHTAASSVTCLTPNSFSSKAACPQRYKLLISHIFMPTALQVITLASCFPAVVHSAWMDAGLLLFVQHGAD